MFRRLVFYIKIIFLWFQRDMIIKRHREKDGRVILILAAGQSLRFNNVCPKQLYVYKGHPIIEYSLRTFTKHCDEMVVVVNHRCAAETRQIANDISHRIHVIVAEDTHDRLDTIGFGLDYIQKDMDSDRIRDIIIHDCARPFIPVDYIAKMSTGRHVYSQFVLRLTNGLMRKKDDNVVDRDAYIELCSPIQMDYRLCHIIFTNFMSRENRYVHEFITVLRLIGVSMTFIDGSHSCLRKITVTEDLSHGDENMSIS